MTFKCEILVHNKESVYVTGQTLTGTVKMTIENNIKTFNKITISLKGKAKLHIVDKATRKNNGNRNLYNFETYEDIEKIAVLSTEGAKYTSGTYVFPFQFIIPTNIPPSVGVIRKKGRYHIKCRIKHRIYAEFSRHDRGHLKEKKKIKEEIIIIAGTRPRLWNVPLIYGNRKIIYGITCRDTVINLKARIEKSILKPGDQVKFSYEVTNDSNINILFVRVKLEEVYTFKVQHFRRSVKIINPISDVTFKSNKILKRSKYEESFEVNLPEDASSIDFAKIVQKDYNVHICVVLPCMRRNMHLNMLVIANAKLDETITNKSNKKFLKQFSDSVLQYEQLKKKN